MKRTWTRSVLWIAAAGVVLLLVFSPVTYDALHVRRVRRIVIPK